MKAPSYSISFMNNSAQDKFCSDMWSRQSWERESVYWEMAKGEEIRDCGCNECGLRPGFCKPALNIFMGVGVLDLWKSVGEEVWFKVGMYICVLDSLTGGFTSLSLEQFQLFHFSFAREHRSAILKVALLTGVYKLICVYLSHPSSRFITPSVRIRPPLFPHHTHTNTTGSFSPLRVLFIFFLEFDTRIAKCLLKCRKADWI